MIKLHCTDAVWARRDNRQLQANPSFAGKPKMGQRGEHWRVFDTALGRIGLLSGHDALFPESARILALMGCDIIACSALSAGFTAAHAGSSVTQNFYPNRGRSADGTYSEP
jgi:predicted amidohydrolase